MRIDARRIRHLIRPAFEWPIAAASTVGHGTFFDTDDFPWVRVLEENWKQIRSELVRLLPRLLPQPLLLGRSVHNGNTFPDGSGS